MSSLTADRIPVLVGAGEILDRPADPQDGLDPLALMRQSLQAAEADAGAKLLALVDRLDVIHQMTWLYDDLPAQLAAATGMTPRHAVYTPVGGEVPIRMILDSAAAICDGRCRVAAICGAEAFDTLAKAGKAQREPDWTPRFTTGPKRISEVPEINIRYGLAMPIHNYPLYENALRVSWGQTLDAAQAESAAIWAQNSEVAAEQPAAWSRSIVAASDIAAISPSNRAIAFPYPKLMMANAGVNQGAAVLVTSLAIARAAGIDEARLVFIGAGASAREASDIRRRDRYDHSPAMEAVLRATLALNGAQDVHPDLVELYSCFPCVPKMAIRTLGWPSGRRTSLVGGLTFFGGPGNNYMTHAFAAALRALRAGSGSDALLYGQGEFVTKHAAMWLTRHLPSADLWTAGHDVQSAANALRHPVPEVVDSSTGAATVETYTAFYDRNGRPERGVVVARGHDGARFLARVGSDDPDTLALLTDMAADRREPIGMVGEARMADGMVEWHA